MTYRFIQTMSSTLSEHWKDIRRVLSVRLDNVGDVVMLGPALRAVHENIPGCRITLMASPGGSQAAALLPWVDDVISWPALWQELNNRFGVDPARELALVDLLRKKNFDAAIIFTSFSQSPYPPAYVCYLAGIPVRIGHSREFGGGVLSHWYQPPPKGGHQAERNLFLLESAGFTVSDRNLAISVPERARTSAAAILRAHGIEAGKSYIYFAPGASAETRRYDPFRSAQLARSLAEETGYPVLIAGSKRETAFLAPVLEECDGELVISLAGRTDLAEAAAIISEACLVVTMNSASLHIADAFQRPIVILYSGTEYLTEWEPRQSPAVLLNREVDCAPCRRFQCPYHKECLDFSPAEVFRAVVGLLSRNEISLERQKNS